MRPLALAAILFFVLFYTSCKKKNDCTAGTDGFLDLSVIPLHHGNFILSRENHRDTVFLKFCTNEELNLDSEKIPTDFDVTFIGETNEDRVHLTNLEPGNYYIYVTAYDTTGPYRVFGGVPFSTDQTSGEVIVNVPVSEVH